MHGSGVSSSDQFKPQNQWEKFSKIPEYPSQNTPQNSNMKRNPKDSRSKSYELTTMKQELSNLSWRESKLAYVTTHKLVIGAANDTCTTSKKQT